jgi:hypothetical protein
MKRVKEEYRLMILTVIITASKLRFFASSLLLAFFESTEIDQPSPSTLHASDNTSVPSFTLPSPTSS